MMRQSTHSSLVFAVLLALVLASCGGTGSNSTGSPVLGAAQVRIALVPTGTSCIEIQAVGATTLTRQFDVAPEANTVFALAGLLPGSYTIAASAYSVTCSQINSSIATYVSTAVPATITLNTPASVTLDMTSQAGAAIVEVGFPATLSPVGVGCIVIQAAGTATINYPFDVAPETNSVFSLLGLMPGNYTFSAQAYPTSCTNTSGTSANWTSIGVLASVVAGTPAIVPLTMTSSSTGAPCNPAPSPKGGGAQAYANQSYCGTLSGTTDTFTSFTGTFTFTTPTAPGTITGCQYSSTLDPPGAATTCTGTTSASGYVLTITDSADNFTTFTATFSTDGLLVSGTFSSAQFGSTYSVVYGTFSGTEQ